MRQSVEGINEDAAAVRLVDHDAPEALARLQDMTCLVRFLDALREDGEHHIGRGRRRCVLDAAERATGDLGGGELGRHCVLELCV